MNKSVIIAAAEANLNEVISIRRHIHENPELSFEEWNTVEFVEKKLSEYGIEFKRMAKTGCVAIIHPKNNISTKCIALRSDLDALPILEETGLSYASNNEGVMHACGHDVHTSILLGTAKIIQENRKDLKQTVKLIFQPGEEKLPGGASIMIENGVLKNPKVDSIVALHVFPELEVGKVGFKAGMYMASTDEIYVTINGKGGHGALPNQVIDPIFIASSIVVNLQQIVSRRCDPKIPSVLSFGHFEALGATNVIPNTAHLKGTFRTMDENWRTEAHQLIQQQIEQITTAFGGSAEVKIVKGYPFLVNDDEVTAKVKNAAIEVLGEENIVELPIRMTAEDFSYYSQKVPACFFRLGVRNEKINATYGVHHSKFAIDEASISKGMQVLLSTVFN